MGEPVFTAGPLPNTAPATGAGALVTLCAKSTGCGSPSPNAAVAKNAVTASASAMTTSDLARHGTNRASMQTPSPEMAGPRRPERLGVAPFIAHPRSPRDAETLHEQTRDRPCAHRCVRDHGMRQPSPPIVDASKRDAGVGALERDAAARAVEPETEAVAPGSGVAPRPCELGDERVRDDPAGEQGAPQRRDVGGARIDPTVTASANRKVEH